MEGEIEMTHLPMFACMNNQECVVSISVLIQCVRSTPINCKQKLYIHGEKETSFKDITSIDYELIVFFCNQVSKQN